ncbi:MAG: TIR domain-containing protein [Anaerolineae bacterium]
MRHIFISYSHADRLVMGRIRARLEAAGLPTWSDEHLTVGTPDWELAIENAMHAAGAAVFVLSPEAKESRWVRIEMRRADLHAVKCFPVLVRGDPREAVPALLINHQYADARSGFRQAVEGMIESVHAHLEALPPDPPPPEPQTWEWVGVLGISAERPAVTVGGRELTLNDTEYTLLRLLAKSPGIVVPTRRAADALALPGEDFRRREKQTRRLADDLNYKLMTITGVQHIITSTTGLMLVRHDSAPSA